MNIVYFEGVLSKVRQVNFKFLAIAVFAVATLTFTGCPGGSTTAPGQPVGENAATVNGKAIKMETIEKAIKAQAQGQEARLSPLELATARLQVLQTLVQQEVMYQKAEAEKTIPTDDEVTQEFNKMKTDSRKSAEDIQKEMQAAGETEATVKEGIKKDLAIRKLLEKVTSKIDAPKDSEIEAFYKGNPDYFVKRKGVRLAAIVIDPNDNGEGDTTKTPADAALKLKEIADQLNKNGDFAAIAREKSEDQSRANGGDLGYVTEDDLKKNYPQLAAFMDPKVQIGQVVGPVNLEGRYYVFKLQERSDKEETLTLESPGVRQQITDSLINARKQLLSTSYTAIALEEAKIDNLLAKQVVNNPNELSGARPAPPANANTNTSANTNANSNVAVVTNTNTATNANTTAVKPAASPAAKANTNTK